MALTLLAIEAFPKVRNESWPTLQFGKHHLNSNCPKQIKVIVVVAQLRSQVVLTLALTSRLT